MKTKYCSRCDTDKPVDEWQKNAATKSGLQSYCRECMNSFIGEDDHHKGHTVYKLTNKLTGDTYIGSTTLSLRKRLWKHISESRIGKQSNLYQLMRVNDQSDQWHMEALVAYAYGDLDTQELRLLEQNYIEELNPTLNMNAACKEIV